MSRGRVRTIPPAAILHALHTTFSLDDAARQLGCSAPSITYAAKHFPEVNAAIVNQQHLREERIAEALARHRGILSKVADELELGSPAAVRYHVFRNPRLRQIYDDSRERVVDRAEENVFTAVEQGSVRDSWQLLKTLGKDRGYTERHESDVRVEHSLDQAASATLVALLEHLAQSEPDAVEAEFSELPAEDRQLLERALSRSAPVVDDPSITECYADGEVKPGGNGTGSTGGGGFAAGGLHDAGDSADSFSL